MYTEVSAGCLHTVLLRSDGGAVATGSNGNGRCDIPKLVEPGMEYTQVFAGENHTILLRSDGTAVSCGRSGVPPSPGPVGSSTETRVVQFRPMLLWQPDFVVQLSIENGRGVVRDMGGEMRLSWDLPAPGEQYPEAYCVQEYVAFHLRKERARAQALRIVLPDNRVLSPRLRYTQLLREVNGAESSTSTMVTKFKFLEWG